jgi:hypothetical protein
VKNNRLIVGGPSITDPIERSKGFEFALLSYHEDRKALEEYQKSDEHHRCVLLYVSLKHYFISTAAAYMCMLGRELIYVCGRVTSTYMFPFKEDLMRFDFEVDEEDEWMCLFGGKEE